MVPLAYLFVNKDEKL